MAMSKKGEFYRTMEQSILIRAAKKHANRVKAGKVSAAGSRTRGKELEAARTEIAAYLARVPEPL
jgi:hypothetical protein